MPQGDMSFPFLFKRDVAVLKQNQLFPYAERYFPF